MYRHWWCAALAAILATVCVSFAKTAPRVPFAYDESDYMYAGTQGFAANYLDRNSLSMADYVRKGLELYRDKNQRQGSSEFIRNANDIDFYRHYHGPIYAVWIATWHAAGVRSEQAYRASGLVLHALGAILIFVVFLRVFPQLPASAAFVAAAMFGMNRSALVAGTYITQHGVFTLLACGALFALAGFLHTRRMICWYAATALLAASFAAVEIAAVLIGSAVVTVVALEWRQGYRALAGLLARGALCFVATLAVLWPPGVLKLNALKGYLYLAYIAVSRKTFTPMSPLDLWGFKIRTYPLEFILPFSAMIVGAAWLWRTKSWRAAAPFVIYGSMFFAVTFVITAPYTYYHASMMMSLSIVTGVLFGEFWGRVHSGLKFAALAGVLSSLIALDVSFYHETARDHAMKPVGTAEVLEYLNSHVVEAAIVAPYVMVPPLHYYRPELVTVGYDETWGDDALSRQLGVVDSRTLVFCGPKVCGQLDPAMTAHRERIGTLPGSGEPLYAMRLTGR
jgi:hypothetical protein